MNLNLDFRAGVDYNHHLFLTSDMIIIRKTKKKVTHFCITFKIVWYTKMVAGSYLLAAYFLTIYLYTINFHLRIFPSIL